MNRILLVVAWCVLLLGARPADRAATDSGLLFHLSGDAGLRADVAAADTSEPNFARDVRIVADGARGAAIECDHTQLLSYWAPGNIFAQRGTLSFFWRSREPVGKTEFPIFRVGYADHSSWDMVWLRIDYNGKPGFDAFVTDASLARTRVSYAMPVFPAPNQWVHLALSWDETRGIRFYVNGQLAARQDGAMQRLDAALDQFGPHSRIISPVQVQSAYNFVRGGDLDELRIYDRMLPDAHVAALARADETLVKAPEARPETVDWRQAWWFRYGWNRAGDPPPPLDARDVTIRKVEIHDAFDLKRWWWKGTDGIRETTWPGVFNRSRLPGRDDYFQLPDWDCYSLSGRSVTFSMPGEPWNHLEVSGSAYGTASLTSGTSAIGGGAAGRDAEVRLFDRPPGQERTFHRLPRPVEGQRIRFTNVKPEMPIGELSAYNVMAGPAPPGVARLSYRLTATAAPDQPSVQPALKFIEGRHPAGERATMVALPAGAPRTASTPLGGSLPIVHVLVPADFRHVFTLARFSYTWANMPAGLDGIALDLPALAVPPTHGDHVPINLQVKDPTWPLRTMLDVSFSVKPGEPHTLWLDLRDRILPNDRGLYLTIAAASEGFGPAALEGAELRLVFKPRSEALAEHVADRFTQVRDIYAHLVEEIPNTRRLDYYNRFETDLTDLLRVDPGHELGQRYWYDRNREQPRPRVVLATPPADVPLWAFRQVEHLGYLKRFVNWYIDHRQIENGEFGGGLSDDGDLTNWWPGTALMGATPSKIKDSLLREMEAFYAQGMFTNGLSTIQTDELHSYEEGIQVLGQSLLLDYGSPLHLERAMETVLAVERLTGINAAGHRHIRSSYFSGTKVSEEGVWGWAKPSSYLILHPALALVEYNGSPRVKKWLLELADGLLAHRRPDGSGGFTVRPTVQFSTDDDLAAEGGERTWALFWAAYRWTGDRSYLQPLIDAGARSLAVVSGNALHGMGVLTEWGPSILAAAKSTGSDALRHLAWQVSGDDGLLAELYQRQAEGAALREYINTEGSLWIDRVGVSHAELQRARLGGVALVRNAIYPGHVVSWTFVQPGAEERVAILLRDPTPERVRVVAYNLDSSPVRARMTAWDVEPGTWTLRQWTGDPAREDQVAGATARTIALDRTGEIDVTFEPRASTVLDLRLASRGTPYWSRPDLGLSAEDVGVAGRRLTVTVHSLGAVNAPASRVVVRDRRGRALGSVAVRGLKAPVDLVPVTARAVITLPAGADPAGGSVTIEPEGAIPEITLRNNRVDLEG